MALDLSVPDWLNDFVAEWARRLSLSDWKLTARLSLCPGDIPDCDGFTDQKPDTNAATLTFCATIEDTEYWRVVVIHELMHVAHSRIDHVFQCAIRPELPGEVQTMADTAYRQYVESYVHRMAKSLVAWGEM